MICFKCSQVAGRSQPNSGSSIHIVCVNDKWRVMDDSQQWILQVRKGQATSKSTGWRDRAYCAQRTALIRCIGEYCGEVDSASVAIIKALPDWHPDRDKKENPAATWGDCRALNHSWHSDSLIKPQRTRYEKDKT